MTTRTASRSNRLPDLPPARSEEETTMNSEIKGMNKPLPGDTGRGGTEPWAARWPRNLRASPPSTVELHIQQVRLEAEIERLRSSIRHLAQDLYGNYLPSHLDRVLDDR